MEREIRQYEHNKKKLERLKLKEKDTRRYIYLEERLQYVETAYNLLRPDEQKVYNMIFKERCNWLYCQTVYNIDKNTYYNTYNKSLYFLAQEWGEI